MRALGVPVGSGRHHCWVFDEPEAFHARVRDFLAEGLRSNERVWYVADATVDVLRSHMSGIGFDDAIARGAARAVPLAQAYAGFGDIPAQEQVDAFAAIVEQSLADGFAGMRVAADATSLIGLDSWRRYEHLVDRFMVGRPLAGLCGFDGSRVDPSAVAEMECLHPIANTATVPFRLTACSPDADSAALTGELDYSTLDLLSWALDAADLRPAHGRVMIDVQGLAFVDHRSIRLLADYAAARGAELVLRDPRRGARDITELLGDPSIRWEGSR